MVDQRLRSQTDGPSRTRRHLSDDPGDLEDISDPHNPEDETQTSLREFVSDNPWMTLATGVFLFIAGIATYFIAGNFAVGLATNPWTIRVAVLGTVAGTVYIAGINRGQTSLQDTDWLVLKTPDGPIEYPGRLRQSANSDAILFVPYKGFGRLGGLTEPYTLGEFAPELTQTRGERDGDGTSEPVTIRLHPYIATVGSTSRGQLAIQLTNGLDVDAAARESHLYTTWPDLVEEDDIDDVRETLEESQGRIQHLEDEVQTLREQRDQMKELAKESHSDAIDSFIQHFERVQQATGRGSPRQQAGGEPGGNGDYEQIQDELADS